jgi:hypothetical protein
MVSCGVRLSEVRLSEIRKPQVMRHSDLIRHQRNADFATSSPHTFCMDFTTFTFVI